MRKILCHMAVALLGLPVLVSAQSNRMFLAGGRGNEKFNTVFQLSDSTVLIAGEAEDLNWIPSGTPILTLDTLNGNAPVSTSPNSLGFILHVSKDLDQILRVLRLPANTLESINRIKSTNRPGETTGDIYFSGRRGGSSLGYFIGRLDKNFLNGIPSKIEMGINISSRVVSTGGKHQYDGPSYHRLFQPWDVDAEGHVLAGTGEEFEFNWTSLEKFRRDGRGDSVEFFPRHIVELDGGTQWPAITGRFTEINTRLASQMPDSVWFRVVDNPDPDPDVFDSIKVAGLVSSSIVLKTYRAGGMRSQTQTEFDLLQSDENGNPGRKSARTDDYMFSGICAVGNCTGDGPGYLGYSLANIWNARIGEVAIDRRNGDMYVTYTIPTNGPVQQTAPAGKATSYDMQPVLVAMEKNGRIKWWARLMKETVAGNSADQITDGLAIDYATNSLVVLGRVYDTCANNYWNGNEIALNPGGNGFQNKWTGSDPKIEYSWLGKYDLTTGRIRYATYVAENAKTTNETGSPLANPQYDNWPDPNSGNPRLAETVTNIGGRTLDVDAGGNVYLITTTKGRPITTSNAYQKMLKPDQNTSVTDSLPSGEVSLIRIYNPTLSGVQYSSVVAGIWNPQDSVTKSPVSLTGVVPTGNGFYIVGSHAGKNLPAESVPVATLAPASWSSDSMRFSSGLVGLHKFGNPVALNRPSAISGPASHCPGETKTYSVTPDPNATGGYQWVMPGPNWTIIGPANGNSVQIRFTGNLGGQLRVVSKNLNGTSEAAFLNIPNSVNPPTVSSTGFVCATGGTATLTALGATPGNYRWYTDSTTAFPIQDATNSTYAVSNITATTRFFVSILGPNGCETERRGVNARFGKSSPSINPLPATGPPYNALQSVPSSLPQGVTRVWRKNGNQIGTGAVVGLSGEGNYTLCFTNSCGDSCVTYVVTNVKATLRGLEVRLSPNPTDGNLNLLLSGENLETIQSEIRDLLGRKISTTTFRRKQQTEVFTLETEFLPDGVYFLDLRLPSGQKTLRFIKK